MADKENRKTQGAYPVDDRALHGEVKSCLRQAGQWVMSVCTLRSGGRCMDLQLSEYVKLSIVMGLTTLI